MKTKTKYKTLQDALDSMMGFILNIEFEINNDLQPKIKIVVPSHYIIPEHENILIETNTIGTGTSKFVYLSIKNNALIFDDLVNFISNDILVFNNEIEAKRTLLNEKIQAMKKKEEEKLEKLKIKILGKNAASIDIKPTDMKNIDVEPIRFKGLPVESWPEMRKPAQAPSSLNIIEVDTDKPFVAPKREAEGIKYIPYNENDEDPDAPPRIRL